MVLHGGKAGSGNGELGVAFVGARASEGEAMSERADGRVVAVLKPSLTRLVGPRWRTATRWQAWPDDGRPPPARSESAYAVSK